MAYCDKHLDVSGRHVNSLLNIAYLTQITNQRISDRNPLEYMQDYLGTDYETLERTHLLPNQIRAWTRADTVAEAAFEEFIEARLDLVLDRLRAYLDLIPFDVRDSALPLDD